MACASDVDRTDPAYSINQFKVKGTSFFKAVVFLDCHVMGLHERCYGALAWGKKECNCLSSDAKFIHFSFL